MIFYLNNMYPNDMNNMKSQISTNNRTRYKDMIKIIKSTPFLKCRKLNIYKI